MIGAITAGLYGVGVPPVTSSYESIATVTVGSGGAADVTFSSIPSTFKHLQIRYIARTARASFPDDNLAIQLNGNTGSVYAQHQLNGNGSTASSGGGSSLTDMRLGRLTGSTALTGNFAPGVIDILDYANTNKNRTLRSLTGNDNNGSGDITLMSGLYQSTTAVSSIKLFSQTGSNNFAQYSSFALYGIKG
jgi:hypothetical protein